MNAQLSTNAETQFSKWFQLHPALGVSMMDHLFARLDGMYPQKWRANFASRDAIDNWQVTWAEAFESEKITPADIKAGIKACLTRFDWPPSLPEFIKACRPSIDPLKAYYEAVALVAARKAGEVGTWSHPAIYFAAMPLAFDLGTQSYAQIKPRWEKAYAEQMARSEWPAIPDPMLALPAPGKSQLSKEKAAAMIAELDASQIAKHAAAREDHKHWARRIINRIKRGDQTVTYTMRKSAEQALGVKA